MAEHTKDYPSKTAHSSIHVFTSAAINYLPKARMLGASIKQHHPEFAVHLALADKVPKWLDIEEEPFDSIISADELAIPNLQSWIFSHSLVELCTGIKPFVLSYLLNQSECQAVFYLDPDIVVFSQLNDLLEHFEDNSILLIPHDTKPEQSLQAVISHEMCHLRNGVYNLGFIGVKNDAIGHAFADWWCDRLYHFCFEEPVGGLFSDQKWIDLVPAIFDGVKIVKSPRFNLAPWNISNRNLSGTCEAGFTVDGERLGYYHFTGFDSGAHESEAAAWAGNNKAVWSLINWYRKNTIPDRRVKKTQWAFSTFENGVPITTQHRAVYRLRKDLHKAFPDPFQVDEEKDSYYRWFTTQFYGSDRIRGQAGILSSTLVGWAYSKIVIPLERPLVSMVKKTVGRNKWALDKLRASHKRILNIASSKPGTLRSTAVTTRSFNFRPIGINVAGYITSEAGIGESVRSSIRSLDAAGILYTLNNLDKIAGSNTEVINMPFSRDNPFNINLIHVNAMDVPAFITTKGKSYFEGRYNIGYWHWELSKFPPEWMGSFQPFNEIWVPSSFGLGSVSSVASIPVVKIPPALPQESAMEHCSRSEFDLAEDRFLFLFVFDFWSWPTRKNPLGVVNAFRQAFGKNDKVCLVIKCAHAEAHAAQLEEIRKAAEGSSIKVINAVLTRSKLNALMNLSDCFLSLHRSEGFGLLIIEAMYLGKPVIATGYSGNMDFMNVNNSFPVKYKLIPVGEKEYPPFKDGYVWADPDVSHAAELMRFVYENREYAAKIGEQASKDIKECYSPAAAGQVILERLSSIAYVDREIR
jgi:glycosyltransferase involved in cell wall biosynthesis